MTAVNVYTERRKAVKTALSNAGFNAFETAPERIAPPLVFIGPGDPYLAREEGRPFASEVMRLDVVVVASRGVNDAKADELDRMILDALDALDGVHEFIVARVDRPGQVSLAGQSHLACAINLETEIQR